MKLFKDIFILVFLMAPYMLRAQTNWDITEDYAIEFRGKGASGNFSGLSGTIKFDDNHLNKSRFDVLVDPSTISTGNKTKDKHARSESWFDVNKYSKIGFNSTQIRKTENGYEAIGQIIMHGISQESKIKFTFNRTGNSSAVFHGSLIVNRKDFGIKGPLMSFMVGDEFVVNIKVIVRKV